MSTYADVRAEYERLLAEGERRVLRRKQGRRGGLIEFVKYFWHILEPETKLVEGWSLTAVCEHLEAITFSDLDPARLLINVPPGFMKSLLTDVFWPAWEWGPMDMAHMRYVTFSYSSSLTERDNRRFGDLVGSPEYQQLYGDRVQLEKRGERLVSNGKKGWKLATSVGGVGTGERGDRIILDDPHNVKEAESETVRSETVRWFRESMSSRLNDMERGAIIIIMQRVHEDDVSGAILSLGLDYHHLMIPMEFEPERCAPTAIGWTDPRYDGDDIDGCTGALAWPERFSRKVCEAMKRDAGPYAWAGQYQQSPTPRGGGIFKRDWWQLWEPPDGKFPVFEFVLASLDSAFTEKEQNDPSGLTIWGVFADEFKQRRIMLVHAWRKHLQFSGPREIIKSGESQAQFIKRTQDSWGLVEWCKHTCERFKVDLLLIEAKASGISAAQEMRNRYRALPFSIHLCQVSGDKVARALSCQATFSQMIIYAPARDWAEMVIDEMAAFPRGKYKDLTDSATQAVKYLRDNGLAETDDEARATALERVRPRGKAPALYPV